jgi:hypothetical protein
MARSREANGKRAMAIALAVLLSSGCSAVKSPGEWFGSGSKTSAKTAGVFFAGADDLAVRDAPSSSGKIVGYLSLHQKVVRSKLTKGYARVRSADGKLEGWVVNAKLLWKPPSATPVAAETPAAADAAPARTEPSSPSPEPDQPVDPAPKKPVPGASVFDPY